MEKKIFCKDGDHAEKSVVPIKSSRYFFLERIRISWGFSIMTKVLVFVRHTIHPI
jgi:hypothetical protein